jgi:hypothetical protein
MQSRVIEDGDICTCCSANILLSKSLTEATASKPSVRLQSKELHKGGIPMIQLKA